MRAITFLMFHPSIPNYHSVPTRRSYRPHMRPAVPQLQSSRTPLALENGFQQEGTCGIKLAKWQKKKKVFASKQKTVYWHMEIHSQMLSSSLVFSLYCLRIFGEEHLGFACQSNKSQLITERNCGKTNIAVPC